MLKRLFGKLEIGRIHDSWYYGLAGMWWGLPVDIRMLKENWDEIVLDPNFHPFGKRPKKEPDWFNGRELVKTLDGEGLMDIALPTGLRGVL